MADGAPIGVVRDRGGAPDAAGRRAVFVSPGRTLPDEMREVTVAADVDADRETILEALSPRSIIEYEGTYEVAAVDRIDDGWRVTAVSRDRTVEMEIDFRRRSDGYVYELVGDGPFEELHTTVTVHGGSDDGARRRARDGEGGAVSGTRPDDPVRVTATSEYTLGGWLAPVVDWLAARNRRRELERALVALASEVGAVDTADAPHDDVATGGDR